MLCLFYSLLTTSFSVMSIVLYYLITSCAVCSYTTLNIDGLYFMASVLMHVLFVLQNACTTAYVLFVIQYAQELRSFIHVYTCFLKVYLYLIKHVLCVLILHLILVVSIDFMASFLTTLYTSMHAQQLHLHSCRHNLMSRQFHCRCVDVHLYIILYIYIAACIHVCRLCVGILLYS